MLPASWFRDYQRLRIFPALRFDSPSDKAYLYGLDVRDGRILWRRERPQRSPIVAEAGQGFLLATSLLSESKARLRLDWIDGRTGRVQRSAVGLLEGTLYRLDNGLVNGKQQWRIDGPTAAKLLLSGDDLFLLDTEGRLLDYPLEPILPATARSDHK